MEFDNLYLDMNNIVHPCCHPEDRAPPEDEEAMMEAIFAYIDRLFALVRPRRLLYMAVDGTSGSCFVLLGKGETNINWGVIWHVTFAALPSKVWHLAPR